MELYAHIVVLSSCGTCWTYQSSCSEGMQGQNDIHSGSRTG